MFIDFYSTIKMTQEKRQDKQINFIHISKKKKKRRMRILGARIFSKFFGGKINFLTGIWMAKSMAKTSIRTWASQ